MTMAETKTIAGYRELYASGESPDRVLTALRDDGAVQADALGPLLVGSLVPPCDVLGEEDLRR